MSAARRAKGSEGMKDNISQHPQYRERALKSARRIPEEVISLSRLASRRNLPQPDRQSSRNFGDSTLMIFRSRRISIRPAEHSAHLGFALAGTFAYIIYISHQSSRRRPGWM